MKRLFLILLTIKILNAAEPSPTELGELKFSYTFYEYEFFIKMKHFDHLKFSIDKANGYEKLTAFQDYENALREFIKNEYGFFFISYHSLKETLDAKATLEKARKYLELKQDPLSLNRETMHTHDF